MYLKKAIELGVLPNLSFSKSINVIRKVTIFNDRLCIIAENLLFLLNLSRNHESARLIYSWNISSDEELILDGLWINNNLFIILTSNSIYLLALEDESVTEVKTAKHGYSQINGNLEILQLKNFSKISIEKQRIIAIVNFCLGFFLVSIEHFKSEYYIEIGSLFTTLHKGTTIPCEDGILFVDSNLIEKFYIDINALKFIMVDSLSIREILNNSFGNSDFRFLSNYKTAKGSMQKFVFLIAGDGMEYNGVEITVSSTNLIPTKACKINVNSPDKIINISQVNISDRNPVKIITYKSSVVLYDESEVFTEKSLAEYNDLNSFFIPFVSYNACETSIFYAGCTLEEKTGNLIINILEKEFNHNLKKNEIQKFENYDAFADLQAVLNNGELLNNKCNGIVPFNIIISQFNKLIFDLERVDFDYIFGFMQKVPLQNIEEALELFTSIVSALEASNSSSAHTKINYLIQKSITFDIIYKNNDKNFEVALKMCSESDSDLSEIGTNWNILLKRFFKCNLGKLCNCLLSLNLVEEFFFLFNRHFIHFGDGDDAIRSEIILESLNSLPVNLPDQIERKIPSWLVNQVFPYVIDKEKLLNWVADRAITLEHISNGDIDRCLFLLSSVFLNEYNSINNQILPKKIVSSGILWAGSGDKRNSIHKTHSKKINQVYWAFLECSDLKNRYKLEIDFSSLYYKKISHKEIAFKLLSRISSSELLNYEINHHVIPFCKFRGLEANKIIMEYLLDLISSINYNSPESNIVYKNRTFYQPRIISLINSITNDEYKAHALLQYLSLNNKGTTINHNTDLKFSNSVKNEIDYLMLCTKNLSVENRKSLELKNRIALIDAQNLLSRYNLESMASIILFEKNAPRRLILHVISQVDAGIESFHDAVYLINYLKHETNTIFMGISEAYCLRLRFIIFSRRNIIGWDKMTKKSKTEIYNKIIEEEISVLLSLIECKERIYYIAQQFVCFIWQFLDFYSINSEEFHRIRIKCEIATYSAIVVLRELLKVAQENKLKIKQKTYWTSNESFNTLIRLQQLQFEFGVFLRPSDIMIGKMDHEKEFLKKEEMETKITHLEPLQNKITLANPFAGIELDIRSRQLSDESFISECKSGYFQLYEESCYKKLCEIFDKIAQPLFEKKVLDEKKTGIFTKLLRLGSLIGVDESYVRRTMIRHTLRDGGKMCIFKRLTQELYKTPSSKNAITIIDEVQDIILNLLKSDFMARNKCIEENFNRRCVDGTELIFIFSKLLQVVATCIPYCPVKLISFVLTLSSDILWAYEFLLNASDAIEHFKNANNSLINENNNHIFSKIVINSLKNMYYLPLDSNKSYYKEICTLYSFNDAINVAIEFLSCKIRICKELSKQISVKKTYISPLLIYNFWTDPTFWTVQSDDNYSIDGAKYIQGLRENIDFMAKRLYQSECLSLAISVYLKHPLLISDMKLVLNINTDFFRKVLNGRDPIDGQLCMALSSSLEKKVSWNVFVQSLNPSNILDNYYRAQRMARIGWDLGILFNHYSMRKEMEDLHKQSKWCNSFRQMKIDFDQSLFFQKQDSQNSNQEYKKRILCKLIQNSCFDLILCLQYAKDYNINDEYVLFLWSKQMILYNFDPKFELKMQNILAFITPELGKEIFESTFELISSIDYERLMFLLNWYNKNYINILGHSSSNFTNSKKETEKVYHSSTSSSYNEKSDKFYENQNIFAISTVSKLEVLKLLLTHKRVCSADNDEKLFIKQEVERIKENSDLIKSNINDEVESQIPFRIPFHYLVRYPIKAMKYEINDETIYKIKKISQYLGIQMIYIDIQFVWNIVLSRKYKFLSQSNLIKEKSKEFEEYCSKLVESDKILLRYIESIALFDLESGIAIVLLIIDELPLSETKIKLLNWCKSKSDKIANVELKKGYPIINMEYIDYSRLNEIITNVSSYLKSKKSLISSILILKKHGLDTTFSKLIKEANDINIFISSLYYYLTPLISEGIYWKFKSKLQEIVCQSFCMNFKSDQEACPSSIKFSKIEKSADIFSNYKLIENFNTFIEEISNVYSSDIRKIRMKIIKDILNKPFETPYEAIKNKLQLNMKDIFTDIESSGIMTGLDHWYKREPVNSNVQDSTYIDRVSFICRGISLNDTILLLLSISFKNSTNYSYSTKCNALRALFQIASIQSIQKRYPKYDDLQVIWLHNYYMIYFNDLHIPQDFSKFYLSEKVGLAKSLWREFINRKSSNDSPKSSQKRFDQIGNAKTEFLIDVNRKRKLRCLPDKENEHSNSIYIHSDFRYRNLDKKLNKILYLITKLCIDFGIYDSSLFSNTIKNLYLQLFDEDDAKIFCDLIFATYVSGYIYKININQSIIDVWNFLILDPVFLLKNAVENISNLVCKYEKNNDVKECIFDNNLFNNLPNQRYIVHILSKIYKICPVTPFIEILKLINALIGLINSIINLKDLISIEKLNTYLKKDNYKKSINHIVSLFFQLVKDISERDIINTLQEKYKMAFTGDQNLGICEIHCILDITILELLFSYLTPIDLHITLFYSSREKIINIIIDKRNNLKLLPYIIYSSSSSTLTSALSLELIKTDNNKLFFEIGAKLKEFVSCEKISQIEEIYLIESIKATKVYEFITCRYKDTYSIEIVKNIRRCIEFYKIESIIPLIIKFLSGEIKSESAILDQINVLEKQRTDNYKLSKMEIYSYIKDVIIKLNKKYKSANIVQELIKQFKS